MQQTDYVLRYQGAQLLLCTKVVFPRRTHLNYIKSLKLSIAMKKLPILYLQKSATCYQKGICSKIQLIQTY